MAKVSVRIRPGAQKWICDAKECTARAPTEYGHPRNVSFQVQILTYPRWSRSLAEKRRIPIPVTRVRFASGPQNALVAQLEEHFATNEKVWGFEFLRGYKYAQMVKW